MAQDAPLSHVITDAHLDALHAAMQRQVACPHPLFEAVEGVLPTTGLLDGPLLLLVGLAQGGRLSEPAVKACAGRTVVLVAQAPVEVSPRGAAALLQLLQLLCEEEGEAAELLRGGQVLGVLKALASPRHRTALESWGQLQHGHGGGTEVSACRQSSRVTCAPQDMAAAVVEVLGCPWAGRHPPRGHAALLEAYLHADIVGLLVAHLREDVRGGGAAGLLNRLVQSSEVAGQQLVQADGLQPQLLARCVDSMTGVAYISKVGIVECTRCLTGCWHRTTTWAC